MTKEKCSPSPAPENCQFFTHHHHIKSQLKPLLMLVTLISFYYHGCYLIISCSLLNGAVVSADVEHNRNFYDGVIRKVLQPQSHNTDRNHHHHDDYQQREHDQHEHEPPQANDIFAKLTHSQGRIDDYESNNNYFDESKDNSDARGVGKFHIDQVGNGVSTSSSSKDTNNNLQANKKRYAFSATKIQAEKTDDDDDDSARETLIKPVKQQKNSADVSCKDESGNDVEWFIAYKLPQISTSQDPLLVKGSKYYFLTADQKSSWKESIHPIDSDQSILATTLQILWKNDSSSNIAKLAYNDQPPSEPAVVMNGHTKGLVWTSKDGGVWLQHSCPHFPDLASQNFPSSYPRGGLINGQMFLCMSLKNASSVDVVGSVLQYTRPHVYNYSIPATLKNMIPELSKVAEKNATVRKAPWFNTYQLQAGSLQMSVYVKGPKFRREIYSTWVAPEYETGLDVQSWLQGAHVYMSNCTSSEHPVYNVLMKNVSSQDFSYTDDHSKWAVSSKKEKPVVCVGDLNRTKPQRTRGGVAICFTDPQVWSAFKSLVKEIQPCNSTSLKHLRVQKGQWKKYKLIK